MKILLTGGAGDLGQTLIPLLTASGHEPYVLDIVQPRLEGAGFKQASLLLPDALQAALSGIDLVVHIAAWHGIHEARGWKNETDFWDLNVNGTHNLIQACKAKNVNNILHISSSSVLKNSGYYGYTKRLSETIVQHGRETAGLRTLILRPRAFIPPWNHVVYENIYAWARRFWQGGVHIQDVARAVVLGVDLLSRPQNVAEAPLLIDRLPEFSPEYLVSWDEQGPGSSFRAAWGAYEHLALVAGLDLARPPQTMDISHAVQVLGYAPSYGLKQMFDDLAKIPTTPD